MFRKTSLVLAVLAALVIVPQAHAAKGDMMLGVRGGVAIPMGDSGDLYKMGFLGGADFDYMVTDAVSVGVDGAFVSMKSKDEYNALLTLLQDGGEATEAKLTIIQFGAHAKYMFPMESSSMNPYIVGGLGLFNGKEDADPDLVVAGITIPEESDTKFGGRIGIGTNFKAGESLMINLEGNFNHIATEGSSTQYISIMGGVSFPLGGSK